MWQLSFPITEEHALFLSQTKSKLKEVALEKCQQWHDLIPFLLKSTPDHLISGYPIYDREVGRQLDGALRCDGEEEEKDVPVTLMGDAAHP
eukprot:12932106-Ditylum_brightwellii.AAC.1